jgi:hypothetical protein
LRAWAGRDVSTPIIRVNAGSEPSLFSQFFLGWDPERTSRNKFVDPYEAKLAALKASKAKVTNWLLSVG